MRTKSIIKEAKHIIPAASHNSLPGKTHTQNLEKEMEGGGGENA